MSLFAGIYSLKQGRDGASPEPAAADIIARSISRRDDKVETWSGDRFFLAKVDVGAFSDAAFIGPSPGESGCVATIAGHPFLAESREPSISRAAHLATLCRSLDDDHVDALLSAKGVFALCHYGQPEGRLFLSTDRAGSRPLYYHIGKDFLCFSTSLHVLESLPQVPKRMDVQGVAEKIAIGFPLADRTPYADIKILENGQYLTCDDGKVRLESYFRWDDIAPTSLSVEQLLDLSYDVFLAAVTRRSAGESSVVANLSGGLDSRCIVTALQSIGKCVDVVTWAMDGYIDAPLAREYASVLGLKQRLMRIPPYPDWSDLYAVFEKLKRPHDVDNRRSNLVFSGDGGSVGVGYDYLTAQRIEWMRTGRMDRVIDHYSSNQALPRTFMRSKMYNKFHEALCDGVHTEFHRIHSHDPARDLHIFYMNNDQRRHLHPLYEMIDICRTEYSVPFLDADFLQLTMSGPVDVFLRHSFYHQWLDRFPSVIKSVAWQTYPGHLACPVPINVPGRPQWDTKRGDHFRGKNRRAFLRCAQMLGRTDFPSSYMSRTAVGAALALHSLHLRCYFYVFNACNELYEVCGKCK